MTFLKLPPLKQITNDNAIKHVNYYLLILIIIFIYLYVINFFFRIKQVVITLTQMSTKIQ
jgi:hypothetical protein